MDLMDRRVDEKNEQPTDCPFRRLFRRQANDGLSSDADKTSVKNLRSSSDVSSRGKILLEEMASTSGNYSEKLMEEFVGDNGSLLSLQPWLFKREKRFRDEDCDASCQRSNEWSGFSRTNQGSPGRSNPVSNWNSIKNRIEHAYNFRPVTFSENFFTSHLCGEDFRVEEYTCYSPPSSPLRNQRPSFHMHRSRPISRLGNDSLGERPEDSYYKETSSSRSTVIGVPHLPPPALRKTEGKRQEARPGTVGTSCSQKLCKISYPQGSFDGMFLFLLGVCIGIASSVLSNRMELEKLNKLLKDNKNLVQDLHDELEMKDLLIVKELANETYRNKELKHHNLGVSINALENQNSEWHATLLKMDEYDHACLTMVGENPVALSEIEAELEAELERLEQNINAFNVGQRISDLCEFDSEIIGDVVQGELREDLLNNGASECHSTRYRGTSSSSPAQPYNANYSVSPKELSLRLHQVIESRLENRIKELECALEESQMKLRLAESERLSFKPVSSSCSSGASSPNHDSPICLQQKHSSPLCLDLSGDQSQMNYQLVEVKRFTAERLAFSSNDSPSLSSNHHCPTSMQQKDSGSLRLNLSGEQNQMNLELVETKKFSDEPPAFSSSDDASPSSNHDCPTTLQQKDSSPLWLDLSGDALVAYDEAYEEFMRLAVTADEKLPSSISTGAKLLPKDGCISEKEQAWNQILWSTGSDDSPGTGDDEDDSDDAVKDLIQKIVEKTKQGSPALIDAQKMFFLMDI